MAKQPRGQIDADTRLLALYGPDEFVRGHHLTTLLQALETAHGGVDRIDLDGRYCTLADVLDEVRSYAMLQTYKVVVVQQADAFVQANRASLERYAATPVDHATLVLGCGRWYQGKLDKIIEKAGAVIRCDPPKKEAVGRWLVDRCREMHGQKLEREAAMILVERLGCDMARLATELDKVMLLAGESEPIDGTLIRATTGRTNEDEAYAVQGSLLAALDSAGRGQRGSCAGTLELVHDLVKLSGQSDVALCYFAADLTRRLEKGVAMRQAGDAPDSILRELRIFGDGFRAFGRLIDQLTPAQAAGWFDRAVAADANFKSGRGTALRNLECLCVGLVADRKAMAPKAGGQ